MRMSTYRRFITERVKICEDLFESITDMLRINREQLAGKIGGKHLWEHISNIITVLVHGLTCVVHHQTAVSDSTVQSAVELSLSLFHQEFAVHLLTHFGT